MNIIFLPRIPTAWCVLIVFLTWVQTNANPGVSMSLTPLVEDHGIMMLMETVSKAQQRWIDCWFSVYVLLKKRAMILKSNKLLIMVIWFITIFKTWILCKNECKRFWVWQVREAVTSIFYSEIRNPNHNRVYFKSCVWSNRTFSQMLYISYWMLWKESPFYCYDSL